MGNKLIIKKARDESFDLKSSQFILASIQKVLWTKSILRMAGTRESPLLDDNNMIGILYNPKGKFVPGFKFCEKKTLYFLSCISKKIPFFDLEKLLELVSGIKWNDKLFISVSTRIHKKLNYNLSKMKYNPIFKRSIRVEEFNEQGNLDKVLQIFFSGDKDEFAVQFFKYSECIKFVDKYFNIGGDKYLAHIIERSTPYTKETGLKKYPSNPIIETLSRMFNDPRNRFSCCIAENLETIAPPSVTTLANREHKNSISHSNGLNELFQKIGGYVFTVPTSSSNSEQCPMFIESNGHPRTLMGFVWIPKSTIKMLNDEKGSCIELDASYDPTNPFVYCIPQLIYHNAGIPLGLIVYRSECFEMYNLFYKAIEHIDKDCFNGKLLQLPIVTDEHVSFNKLQDTYKMPHYHCYVHLIRSFGASTFSALLVKDILYSSTIVEFDQKKDRILYHYKKLVEDKNSSIHNANHKQKFEAIFGFNETGESVPRDPTMLFKHYRNESKIPTTTNHAELFHDIVNRAVTARASLPNRIGQIIETIDQYVKNINDRIYTQIHKHFIKLKKMVGEYTNDHPSDMLKATDCTCNEKLNIKRKYGFARIPCIHQVNNPDFQEFKSIEQYGIPRLNYSAIETDQPAQIFEFTEHLQRSFEQFSKERGPIALIQKEEIIPDDPYTTMLSRVRNQLQSVINIKVFELVSISNDYLLSLDDNHIIKTKNPSDPELKRYIDVYTSYDIIQRAYAYKKRKM